AEASRLVYDAIRTSNWLRLGVVSNGRQTGDIFRKLTSKKLLGWFPFYRRDEISDIGDVLKRWGHEGKVGDRYNTPRIAGVIDASGGHSWLGMITAEKEDGMYNVARIRRDRGQARYISTYTGEGEEPQATGVKEVANPANKQKIAGRKAQELAEEMYGFMDPAFVVAAAAALWDPQQKRWELAVKNKS
ncbi:MAG: hypothetical protein HYS53_00015, partial [Candidatus Aenigmarchaeota archaeon]|nr:hypothetical protein [Candidatus Aenigmarchaeota archaeon]